MINLNNLRDRAYKIACDHGFHDDKKSKQHFLCLVTSELMEAVEADRKDRRAIVEMFKEYEGNSLPVSEEDRLTKFKEHYDEFIKGSVEEELADACIRLLDLAGDLGFDIHIPFGEEDDDAEFFDEFKKSTFIENIYFISLCPAKIENYGCRSVILEMLCAILEFAKYLGIDILWHIEKKMDYNELRMMKHGKKY